MLIRKSVGFEPVSLPTSEHCHRETIGEAAGDQVEDLLPPQDLRLEAGALGSSSDAL